MCLPRYHDCTLGFFVCTFDRSSFLPFPPEICTHTKKRRPSLSFSNHLTHLLRIVSLCFHRDAKRKTGTRKRKPAFPQTYRHTHKEWSIDRFVATSSRSVSAERTTCQDNKNSTRRVMGSHVVAVLSSGAAQLPRYESVLRSGAIPSTALHGTTLG